MDKPLNQYIDHTNLKPAATAADIDKLCDEARRWGFASVCVQPCRVRQASERLAGSGVRVCTVIGFPLGANTAAVKASETRQAVADGAEEVDMVINIGALKDGGDDLVRDDIRGVVAAADGRLVKVIIETFYLSDEEKARAARLAAEAGADFVKTCTGFNAGVATAADVKILKAAVPERVKVKASAGIRGYTAAMELIAAGADRLGTSSGVAIVEEAHSSGGESRS